MIREKSLRLMTIIILGSLLVDPGNVAPQTTQQKQSAAPVAKKKAASRVEAAAPVAPELEPKALEILKATASRLAAAHTLSFTAVETFESPSRQGVPLVFANKYEVTLQRPDKLRVIIAGDGPASEFYDDGKIALAFAPTENLVAVTDAPPTIDATLQAIYHRAAIYFPFTDLIVSDPYADLAPGLRHAYYIGQSIAFGGTTTDMIAYAGDGVFVQMAVGIEDRLPRVAHAIYLNDPDRLRHNLLLSDWQIDAPVSADVFTSSKATSAKHMEFAHPHPEPSSGARPPLRTPPPTRPVASSTAPQSN